MVEKSNVRFIIVKMNAADTKRTFWELRKLVTHDGEEEHNPIVEFTDKQSANDALRHFV